MKDYNDYKNGYYILVFKSKNYAIKVYYLLEKKGYSRFQLVSTPCKIQPGCSFSIKFTSIKDFETIKREITELDKIIDSIYFIKKENGKKVFKKINYII